MQHDIGPGASRVWLELLGCMTRISLSHLVSYLMNRYVCLREKTSYFPNTPTRQPRYRWNANLLHNEPH